MNKFLLLLNLVQFAIILVLTNPPEGAHREALLTAIKAEMAANTSLLDKLKNAAEVAKGISATYDNYYVCATTTREGKMMTFGMLGTVRWVGGTVITGTPQPK